jgi:hypothetical protein
MDLDFDSILKEAVRLQDQIRETYRGFQSTRNLNEDRDLIGAIGQLWVIEQIKSWGFVPQEWGYFDPNKRSDDCDFIWRYEKCDVKASPTQFPQIYRNSRFLIKDDSESKKVDHYIFVKVDLAGKKVVIAGCMKYNCFWEDSLPFESYKIKYPCHYILAKDLTPFEDFIYA